MGLFGGTRERTNRKRGGRVLRAAGMRIQTGQRESVRALAATRQEWQSDAWGYRDSIGELRLAVQFLARAVARVKFMAAQVIPDEDEPIPLSSEQGVTIPAALRKAAQEELERLPLSAGYSFLGVLAENLEITGEAWLHGYERGGEERWEVRSVDEVHAGADGTMSIREFGTATMTPVDPNTEEMLRQWVPHPRFKILADSPMRSLRGPCEELILLGREMRAVSRSRFAANGLLLVPNGLTLLNALKEDTDLADDERFMADLVATLLAPISNEGDPGAIAPAVITGDNDDLERVRHVKLERESSAEILEKAQRCLARIAAGLDVPPEIITGMSDANHWTAWQIDASTYRHHIDPLVRIVADSLTEAFLRPALLARGFSNADVKMVQVWYDAGHITENPNRGQDAKDAFDRGAIGFKALADALGFNDSDAPSDEEVLRMVAFKIGVDPATAGLLLQSLFGRNGEILVPPAAPNQVPSERADEDPALPPGEQPSTSDRAIPDTKPPELSQGARMLLSVLKADAAPEPEETWYVDEDGGRKLMEIDRAERDRLMMAADAALTRSLEKAGARLKSKAQKDPALRASLAGVDVLAVGQMVGRARVAELATMEELLGDSLDGLEEKFTRWTLAAIERAISAVLALLRVKPDSDRGERIATRLRDGLSGRVDSGWSMFRDALLRLAEQYLYNPHPDQEPGEAPDVIVPPGLVRGVLAHVGGAHPDTGGVDDDGEPAERGRPLGGIGLGEEVSAVLEDEGAEELGFEWIYGITAIRHFEPHQELDGRRFSSWKDPDLQTTERWAWVGPIFQPGDHKGCMCDYMPAYAIREYSETIADRLSEETENARNDRLLAESDDRAGRTGTTAQQARDQRERILSLRERYIKAGSDK